MLCQINMSILMICKAYFALKVFSRNPLTLNRNFPFQQPKRSRRTKSCLWLGLWTISMVLNPIKVRVRVVVLVSSGNFVEQQNLLVHNFPMLKFLQLGFYVVVAISIPTLILIDICSIGSFLQATTCRRLIRCLMYHCSLQSRKGRWTFLVCLETNNEPLPLFHINITCY